MKKVIITFSFLLCFSICLNAQTIRDTHDKSKDTTKSILQEFGDFLDKKSISKSAIQINLMELSLHDSLLKTEYEYDISKYKHRRNVFDWQYTSSIIIFWIVIIIVFVGLIFSGMQFYISIKRGSDEKEAKSGVGDSENVTEFEASIKGIKVSSSVLGIIILVISLVFFYLYLVHVYPIKEVINAEHFEEIIEH